MLFNYTVTATLLSVKMVQKLNGVFENKHKTFCYTFCKGILDEVHEKATCKKQCVE